MAIIADALVMAVDGAAIAVLHAVHQRGLHPLPAIGEHRIGRYHLVKRRFLRSQCVGQNRRQVVIYAEPFGIAPTVSIPTSCARRMVIRLRDCSIPVRSGVGP